MFACATKHGCREIALQHKQFKTKMNVLDYGCDNSVALVTEVYVQCHFISKLYVFQLVWHRCMKIFIGVRV